jgi:curved DNA-binding protein CbpA
MVNRVRCEKAYKVLGTPSKKLTLDYLLQKQQRQLQSENRSCIQRVNDEYEILKTHNFSLDVEEAQTAIKAFGLEEGNKEYVDDIREELIEECNAKFESKISSTRLAKEFLKDNLIACDFGIKCADSYSALGLKGGDKDDINKQYRSLSKKHHPDLCKDDTCASKQEKKQETINQAKKFLLDEQNHCLEISNLNDFFAVDAIGSSSGDSAEL